MYPNFKRVGLNLQPSYSVLAVSYIDVERVKDGMYI